LRKDNELQLTDPSLITMTFAFSSSALSSLQPFCPASDFQMITGSFHYDLLICPDPCSFLSEFTDFFDQLPATSRLG